MSERLEFVGSSWQAVVEHRGRRWTGIGNDPTTAAMNLIRTLVSAWNPPAQGSEENER